MNDEYPLCFDQDVAVSEVQQHFTSLWRFYLYKKAAKLIRFYGNQVFASKNFLSLRKLVIALIFRAGNVN